MKYILAPFVGVGIFVAIAVTFATVPLWAPFFAGLEWLEERGWR